jgi:hypothetical protein
MDSICKDIGIKENPLSKDKVKEISSPILQKAADKLTTAKMRIEALQYEQPPAKYKDEKKLPEDQQDPTKYIFVASINWEDKKAPIEQDKETNDFFKLKGLIFGISSGFTNDQGDNPEVQKAFLSALQTMTPVAALPPAKTDSEPETQASRKDQENPAKK